MTSYTSIFISIVVKSIVLIDRQLSYSGWRLYLYNEDDKL